MNFIFYVCRFIHLKSVKICWLLCAQKLSPRCPRMLVMSPCRMLQSRLTWCRCWPPSAGTTPSAPRTPPASTGSASTRAPWPTRAPPTRSVAWTTTSPCARVRLATSGTPGSSASNRNVSLADIFQYSDSGRVSSFISVHNNLSFVKFRFMFCLCILYISFLGELYYKFVLSFYK